MEFNVIVYSLILAQIYSALTLMILFKTFRPTSFLKTWKVARILYILILIACIFRSVQYWILMIINDLYHDKRLDAISIAIPYNLSLAAYLVIIWIMYTTNDISRLRVRSLTVVDLSEDTFRWLKSTKVTITAVVLILTFQLFFYFLYLLEFIGFVYLADQYIALEGALGCLFFGVRVWIEWRYRGIPYISEEAHRVFSITKNVAFAWAITRFLHLLWFVFYISGLTDITAESIDDGSLESLLEMGVKLGDKLLSDCVCWYLIADSRFKDIFAKGMHDDLNPRLFKTPSGVSHNQVDASDSIDSSLISAASFVISTDNIETLIHDDSLIFHELYFDGAYKLGDLHLGLYRNIPILIRRVSLPRANKFVIDKFLEDISFLKRIQYDRLVKIHGAIIHAPCIDIVMDYYPEGSLFNKLHRVKAKLSLMDRVNLAREISMILVELHHKKIYHGHLTPYNILFDSYNNILLADIGLKHLKKYAGLVSYYCNKTCWSSPKILSCNGKVAKNVTREDDVYSFGIILWEILTSSVPYEGIGIDKLRQLIIDGYRPVIPENLAIELQTLIKVCWNNDPKHRPSFKYIFSQLSNFHEIESSLNGPSVI